MNDATLTIEGDLSGQLSVEFAANGSTLHSSMTQPDDKLRERLFEGTASGRQVARRGKRSVRGASISLLPLWFTMPPVRKSQSPEEPARKLSLGWCDLRAGIDWHRFGSTKARNADTIHEPQHKRQQEAEPPSGSGKHRRPGPMERDANPPWRGGILLADSFGRTCAAELFRVNTSLRYLWVLTSSTLERRVWLRFVSRWMAHWMLSTDRLARRDTADR
jgi:hypothetical protein